MIRYRNRQHGRVVQRPGPDQWLDASKRWERMEPLSPIPMPERAPDDDESDGHEPEHENDGPRPSGKG